MSGTRHRPKKGNCDYGNSVIGGLRRLDKAAQRGDPKAAEMLRRVLDQTDATTVHAACVVMGWRKQTLTVVATLDGILDALPDFAAPIEVICHTWLRASDEQREAIAALFRAVNWVDTTQTTDPAVVKSDIVRLALERA
jgi:hypothetical protein